MEPKCIGKHATCSWWKRFWCQYKLACHVPMPFDPELVQDYEQRVALGRMQ